MAEMKKVQDLSKSESAGEKVLKQSGVKGLVASDLPSSEVVSTLTKRVRTAKTQTEKYDYLAPKLFMKNMVFDGLLDVNYTELITTGSNDPYADTEIGDFNGDTNKAIRFTYEAVSQSNVKTKMLNDVIMNFKTIPGDAITAIYKGTENINKAQSLKWAEQSWTALTDRIYTVELPVGTEDIANKGDSVAKKVFETLRGFETTKKTHIGVGTDLTKPGIITDSKGNEVKPSMRFDSSEFYVLTKPDYEANITFDGERQFFNWGANSMPVAGTFVMDIAEGEEFPEVFKNKVANSRVILIHKNAIAGVQDWEGTGVANAGKLYTVYHNYMKQDAYPIYDAPVIAFDIAAAKSK